MVDRNDFKVDVYRSRDEATGASNWAVRVTHVPSGVTAMREGEGSESLDRETAVASAMSEIENQLGR
jgi:protein subunit release factor A